MRLIGSTLVPLGTEDVVDDAVRRAETLVDLGRFAQAEELLRRHLAQQPGDAVGQAVLGRALLAQDNAQEAVEAAKSAIAGNPQLLQPRITLTEAYLRLRWSPDARAAAEALVESAPMAWQSYYTRARVGLTIGGRYAVDALPDAIEAVRLAPHLADPHVLVGQCYNAASQPWRAAEAYRNALAIDPEHARAARLLALADLQTGRRKHAIGGLTTAVQLDPTDTAAASTLELVRTARTGRLLLVVYVFAVLEMFLGVGAAPWPARAGVGGAALLVAATMLVLGLARVPSGRRRAAMVRTWTMIAERMNRPMIYYAFCTVGALAIAAFPTSHVHVIAIVFAVIFLPVTLYLGIAARVNRSISDR